jgi:hypothetical protein
MHHQPLALADGNTILYSDFDEGRVRLGVFTIDDSTTGTLELEAGRIAGVAGDILVYLDRRDNLMAARVDLKARRVIGEPMRIPTGTGTVRHAAMSPTGTLVIYAASLAYQAALVDARGVAEPLVPDTVNWLLPRYSPDARALQTQRRQGFRGSGSDLVPRRTSRPQRDTRGDYVHLRMDRGRCDNPAGAGAELSAWVHVRQRRRSSRRARVRDRDGISRRRLQSHAVAARD